MELLTEKQVAELIVECENKNKEWVDKIKQELQNRKELKKKLEEAKQREAVQLQVLERLEESEKMVRKELELVAKFEDNESLKQLAMVKKYEDMLAEQKKTWELYKEQYESLPSVTKVRKAEAELLYSKIQLALKVQKMKDMKRMLQLRELVRKKQEQAQIIKLAEMYVQYMRRERRCRELWDQNKKLTAQALHLRQELQEREKAKQMKLSAEKALNLLEKASELMKPQQLPQVDLSHFIIHRDKGNDKLDTMSINSYILEEEYMNNNGQSISKLNSSQNKAMDVDNQDSMHMDIDTQGADSQERELAQSNEASRRLDFEGAFGNEGKTQCTPPEAERNNNEMQSHVQSASSNQSRSQVDGPNKTYDQNPDSQESRTSDACQDSARKRASQKPPQNEEDATMHVSFANNENAQNTYSTPYDRPIPTPAKMTKSSFQEKHPRFQQTPKQEVVQQQRYRQETPQQNQNHQVSNRSSRDNQQQAQYQQLPKRSSQEMTQQQQQQQSRHSSQESYQQQQQMSREVYQQNQQQQTPRQPQEVHQQNQQQQQSRHPSQETYQQTPRQQEAYLRNEQRQSSQQPMQVSPQNSEQMDFSRLPTNKPRIILNEHVNLNLQNMQRNQTIETQPKAQPTPRTPMETPTAKNVAPPKSESTPFAYQVPFEMNVNVTPMSAEIHPSSMMSTTMHSVDNSYLLPDNISAILGSEITEPGGSFELARRLHDTDSISDLGDMDYNYQCSPIHKISPKAPVNISTQPPADNSITQNTQDSNANSNNQVFSFGSYTKKQTNKFF